MENTKNITKQARFATANSSKVGDIVAYLIVPYFEDDLRLYYTNRKISNIEVSKTGKRVRVTYTDGYVTEDIGPNTTFQEASEKFLKKEAEVRGWRETKISY